METKRLILICILILISIFVLSCAAKNRIDLLNNDYLKLETVPSRGINISRVYVYKESDGIRISGMVKNRGVMSKSFGHVDIAILNSEGKIIKELSTYYIPRILFNRRRHPDGSHFNVSVPFIPPEGSKILIAYHKVTTKKNTVFHCEENRAILAHG